MNSLSVRSKKCTRVETHFFQCNLQLINRAARHILLPISIYFKSLLFYLLTEDISFSCSAAPRFTWGIQFKWHAGFLSTCPREKDAVRKWNATKSFGKHAIRSKTYLLCCWIVSLSLRGMGLLSHLSSSRYFLNFSEWSKRWVLVWYHVNIRQVSLQLSWQIWAWLKISSLYFCQIEISRSGEVNERTFDNFRPWLSNTSVSRRWRIRPTNDKLLAGMTTTSTA